MRFRKKLYDCRRSWYSGIASYKDIAACEHGDIWFCQGNFSGRIGSPGGYWMKVEQRKMPVLYWRIKRAARKFNKDSYQLI